MALRSEKVHLPKVSRPFIVLQGLDPLSTIISYNDWAGKLDNNSQPLGTFYSCSVCIFSKNFVANNLTFEVS